VIEVLPILAQAAAVIEHNTLIDTAGIDVRFADSSASVRENIVDGVIRARNGATLHATDNLDSPLLGLFVGWHPQQAWFIDPAVPNLRWRAAPPPAGGPGAGVDLCGARRPAAARPGAFEDFTACLHQPGAG
jgi:hypothetical protein